MCLAAGFTRKELERKPAFDVYMIAGRIIHDSVVQEKRWAITPKEQTILADVSEALAQMQPAELAALRTRVSA